MTTTTYRSTTTNASVHILVDGRGCYYNYCTTYAGQAHGHRTRHGKSLKAAQAAAQAWLAKWEASEAARKAAGVA
jgi:hypothetical protein